MPRRSRTEPTDTAAVTPKRRRRSARIAAQSIRDKRDDQLGGADQTGRRLNVPDGDFLDKNPALKDVEGEGSELQTQSLDLLLVDNRKAHHTDQYEQEELIVRRGQPFDLSLTFDRPVNKEKDTVILQFTIGSRPQESKGTVIRLAVDLSGGSSDSSTPPPNNDDWHAVAKPISGDEEEEPKLTVSITTAAESVIGRYHFYVETRYKGDDDKLLQSRLEFDETVLVLFNVWCKEDSVYMDEEDEREEYVLNDKGRLWRGTAKHNESVAWNLGQFEDVCLEAALYLLDKAELSVGSRSNPCHVLRTISAMANSNDADGGVLTGRWTDTYPKSSTVPWAWVGSVAILEEFMQKKRAVKYGQCWVFSGLVTTLCRTLGIPTRSVTNFESAHDTDDSMTIDCHWNEQDDPVPELNDSIWNFHVWNESYLKRPDLPDGYDGWQAFDSTPQELSEGVMKCGPAPVRAIKEGLVYLPYDAPFIFAEVNGDRVHWLMKDDGSMEVLAKETAAVGMKISTKSVSSNRRKDLTSEYKHKEGSEEERKAVHRAFRYSSRREHQVYDVQEPDVVFDLVTPENVEIGSDFGLKVKLRNKSDEARNVRVRLSCIVSYYTGVPSEDVDSGSFTHKLGPNEEGEVNLDVYHKDYESVLKPDSLITCYLKGTVEETNKSYAHVESFALVKPSLKIKVPDKVVLREEFDITIRFTNPLSTKLTHGVFHIEAAGIIRGSLTVPYKKSIGPGEEANHTLTLTSVKSGDREIVVNFSADQLSGLSGSTEVYVSYA